MSVNLEAMNQAFLRVFGDPGFRAEMKRLNEEHDAALARMGLTREMVEEELARQCLLRKSLREAAEP